MPITWTCHACKEERPDDCISVKSVPLAPPAEGRSNFRYCNDRVGCIHAARRFKGWDAPKEQKEPAADEG